jgi:hypothetical protein
MSGLDLVNGHLAQVDRIDLSQMVHARRLILRHTSDPCERFTLLRAVGIPYVLCPCGAAMPDDAHPHATSVRALLAGWRQELGEHHCEGGVRPSAVLRCPDCVAAKETLRRWLAWSCSGGRDRAKSTGIAA